MGEALGSEKLIGLLNLNGDEVILDVGCGRGLLLNCAAKKLTTGKAIGLDLWQNEDQSGNSPEITLKNARLEGVANRASVISGDMRKIPLENASIDAVVSSIAIHNIQERIGRQEAIARSTESSVQGGRLYC